MSHLQQNSRALPTNIDSNSTHPFPGIELPADYNMHEVPWTDDGGPVKVNFSINLSSILAIDEPKQVHIYYEKYPRKSHLKGFKDRILKFKSDKRVNGRPKMKVVIFTLKSIR